MRNLPTSRSNLELPIDRDTAQANLEIPIPERLRVWVTLAIFAHLSIVLLCLLTSNRLSNVAMEWLGFVSPYAVTTNLQINLQSIAVTEPTLLESPLQVRFRASSTDASGKSGRWIDWSKASHSVNGLSQFPIRRNRYLRQLSALIEVQSEDGVAKVVAAMLQDLQANPLHAIRENRLAEDEIEKIDEFQILQMPVLPSNEWQAAERFRSDSTKNQSELPAGLQPQTLLSARIVWLADGTVGILPEVDAMRTSPLTESIP